MKNIYRKYGPHGPPWDPGPKERFGPHGPHGTRAQQVVIDVHVFEKQKIEMRAWDLSKKNRGKISRRGV